MLHLKRPELSELVIMAVIKAKCCNCTAERIIETSSHEEAARALCDLGWMSYETDDEIGPVACPVCVSELKKIDQEEKLSGLYPDAVAFVKESGRASISALQRKFKIGYNRAAGYMDEMEKNKIVSEPADNGARTVFE